MSSGHKDVSTIQVRQTSQERETMESSRPTKVVLPQENTHVHLVAITSTADHIWAALPLRRRSVRSVPMSNFQNPILMVLKALLIARVPVDRLLILTCFRLSVDWGSFYAMKARWEQFAA